MIKFVLLIIAIMLIWGVSIRNRLKQYLVVIDESKESVDIALEKRYDTIFERMKIAKAYAKHEEKVFTEVVRLRQGLSMKETNDVIRSQNRAISEIFAVAENYPELKANENFRDLQSQLEGTENRIAVERKRFNEAVQAYNLLTRRFPQAMLANMFGFREKSYFKADEQAATAPKVSF